MFVSLFAEDAEGQKLNLIPGADELLAEFHDKFVVVCKEMYQFGKSQKLIRDKEVSDFWKCFNDAKNTNTEEATFAIEAFMEIKKRVYTIYIGVLYYLLSLHIFILIQI